MTGAAPDRGAAAAEATATVLLVDDEPVNLHLLRGMLEHRVDATLMTARDGAEAVALVRDHAVDLVLMDVMMPGMDGFAATRRIKALDTDRYTPVLFVTALDDDAELAQCVACGGDDFIAKPVSRIQLNARVDSWLRVAQLYRTVRQQRDALDAYQRHSEVDQWIAREVMQRATATPLLEERGVAYWYRPAKILGGDMLLAARDGQVRSFFLVGDFTGHGIAASIGTVPTAELFQGAVAAGFDPDEVLEYLNEKLHAYLPAHLFMAAALVVCNPGDDTVEIWNGGMPDILYRGADGTPGRLTSRHLPLGVRPDLDPAEMTRLRSPRRLWVVSDGVIEARDARGDAFGVERTEAALLADGLNALRTAHETCGALARDDVTVLELDPAVVNARGAEPGSVDQAADWTLSLELDAPALREASPLQPLADGVARMEGLGEEARQSLLTILAELYSNGLEHGVLGLDSGLKRSSEGFSGYYERRMTALGGLRHGRITIRVERRADAAGPYLRICMSDTGRGFDHRWALQNPARGEPGLSGRGIPLLRGICDSLVYRGRGNRVEAHFRIPCRAGAPGH